MPPFYRQQGPLFMWVGAFHIRKADYLVILSDMGVTYPFTPPILFWPCLPRPSSMIGHIPLGVHYLPASTRYRCCSLCLMYMFLLKSAAK